MNDNFNRNEFQIFGLKIEKFSLLYGCFLVLWGIVISFVSGSNSLTSYIPSVIGLPILIFSYLAIKFENKKKLFMHIVVFFGLIVFIGGLDVIRSFLQGSIFSNFWADLSKLIMLLSGFFFTLQCVRSFIYARKIKDLDN